MFIFSLANVLHQSLEPEDAAKVLILHFCRILSPYSTIIFSFWYLWSPTNCHSKMSTDSLARFVIYFPLTRFNKNDIDHLVGQLTKFNLFPGARGCRGPRSNRIGEGSSWMMILSQRDLCWTNRWNSYTVNMRDGESRIGIMVSRLVFLSQHPVLHWSWPMKYRNTSI